MTLGRARCAIRRRPLAVAATALALTWLATLTLLPWSDESVGDLGVRSSFADRMLSGDLPYRDFSFEYPPLSAPAIALPGLAGTDLDAYRLGIAALTFLAALAVLSLVRSLARRTGAPAGPAMAAVVAAPLLLGAVIRLHVDLVPVAVTLGALVALLARRPALGMTLVGLGAATKGFPLVVAPVALAWLFGCGDRRAALRGALALAATLAAVAVAWIALSPQGAVDSLAYQLDRPIQVESTPASALLVAGALGGDEPQTVDSHASVALDHALATPVGVAFGVALVAAITALSVGAWRAGRAAFPTDTARGLILAALAAVVAGVALGRVLSPQYLVWALPLLAVAFAWRAWALAAAAAAACALTLAEFPSRYFDLVDAEPAAVAVVATRNAALLVALVLAAALLARLPAPAAGADSRTLRSAAEAPGRSIGPARPAPPR